MLKKILIALVLAVLIFVGLNFGYFWANLKFSFYRPTTPPIVSSAANSVSKTPTPLLGQAGSLSVPSLGISAPIIYIDKADEPTFQAALINGVVHYPGTALPGQNGNVYIFGHSSDYAWSGGHFKSVFALLPRIANGAEIKITGPDGQLYTYIVTQRFPVAKTDTQYLAQDLGKKIITLQTSYPVGTALARYIVIGELQP